MAGGTHVIEEGIYVQVPVHASRRSSSAGRRYRGGPTAAVAAPERRHPAHSLARGRLGGVGGLHARRGNGVASNRAQGAGRATGASASGCLTLLVVDGRARRCAGAARSQIAGGQAGERSTAVLAGPAGGADSPRTLLSSGPPGLQAPSSPLASGGEGCRCQAPGGARLAPSALQAAAAVLQPCPAGWRRPSGQLRAGASLLWNALASSTLVWVNANWLGVPPPLSQAGDAQHARLWQLSTPFDRGA